MSPEITNGLFLLASVLITGFLTIFAGRSSAQIQNLKNENESNKRNISQLLKQVESYHLLEDVYANELASASSKQPKTIKTEYRNKVVELHQCERPEMTANEAKKRLQKIT
ncbi:MAG: hypothetical protein NXI15_09070 [Gammaproteobacteria bacterium]|jgi:hypothetical protein|nr:hypothetical protein [Gammaproteobacteria bacterium]